ncbi:MAG: 2TM domain-containing protein [Bacteroidota bacterium]|nr:2TM domain-containing protein [Bacteroidota bacterium]
MENEQDKDRALWQMAKRRAAFKTSFVVYIVVNLGLVAIWYFSSGPGTYFWPVWPALGWGIGIALQYASAYHSNKVFSVEEEYKKLKEMNK